MVLINESEIIPNVIVREDGTFETKVSGYSRKESNSKDSSLKKRLAEHPIPYIDIPTTVVIKNERMESYFGSREQMTVDDVECEIGYLKPSNGVKEKKPIVFGNVELNKFLIKTNVDSIIYSSSWAFPESYTVLEYHYEITISIFNEKGEKIERTLLADDSLELRPWTDKEYKLSPIYGFLRNIAPRINNYILAGYDIKRINFAYLEQLLPQCKEKEISVHTFKFSDALDIVYTMQLGKDINGNDIVEFGKNLLPFINHYIVEFINSKLQIRLLYDSVSKTFKAELPPINFPQEIISLQHYLQCTLFMALYESYDDQEAEKYYLVNPIVDKLNVIHANELSLENNISDSFLNLFDFIANIEASHFADGRTRVGRDDIEWEEKTFIFPYKEQLKDIEIIVDTINRILGIKLLFEEETDRSTWHQEYHPARYYYFNQFNKEYVSGLACNRFDMGSAKLKKESFYKLLDYFIKGYIQGITM